MTYYENTLKFNKQSQICDIALETEFCKSQNIKSGCEYEKHWKSTRGSIATHCEKCKRDIMISLNDFPNYNEPDIFFCNSCEPQIFCNSCEPQNV